jgi:hypothetical protein
MSRGALREYGTINRNLWIVSRNGDIIQKNRHAYMALQYSCKGFTLFGAWSSEVHSSCSITRSVSILATRIAARLPCQDAVLVG